MSRLFLDDVRPVPAGFDYHAKTEKEAIAMLSNPELGIDFISFDHDLGAAKNGTGYGVACWLEAQARSGARSPIGYAVHSANPVGKMNIISAMTAAEHFWNEG
jgi:hypothetical protein